MTMGAAPPPPAARAVPVTHSVATISAIHPSSLFIFLLLSDMKVLPLNRRGWCRMSSVRHPPARPKTVSTECVNCFTSEPAFSGGFTTLTALRLESRSHPCIVI